MDFILKTSSLKGSGECEEKRLFLSADATKKSVFWLDPPPNETETTSNDGRVVSSSPPEIISITSPAEGNITRRVSKGDPSCGNHVAEDQMFAWGGLQITSNAKAIEIYFTTPPSSASTPRTENYLTTVKGIPATGTPTPDLFKALCAVPGGPKAVLSVRLKFLCLHPKGSLKFRLATFKWTARLMEPASEQSATHQQQRGTAPMPAVFPSMAALMGGTNIPEQNLEPTGMAASSANGQLPIAPQPEPAPPPQEPPVLTKEDIGVAMAGMTFALRSTEERITAQLQKTTTSNQILHNQIRALTLQISQQSQLLQNQNELIQKQQELLAEHTRQIQSLQQRQQKHVNAHQEKGITVPNTSAPNGVPNSTEEKDEHDSAFFIKQQDIADNSPWRHYASIEL